MSSSACEIEHLKLILEEEQKNRCLAREKVNDLSEKIADFIAMTAAKCESNRESKYDPHINKQLQINEKISARMEEDRQLLEEMVKQMAPNCHISGGGVGNCCQLNICDLLLDYSTMTKSDLVKEIKRFDRLQMDLKSNIDRLQWRLDSESKTYYNLMDQYQKLQIELYYLQNLGEKYSFRSCQAVN